MSYQVKLEIFEGPLDLLLHLIKKNELDIYDIPIALITKQYMQYLELMKRLNLDIAGEFLVMAASLMYIKSKSLLPSIADDEDEEDDPQQLLVSKLLDYQRFKNIALNLREYEANRQELFTRTVEVPEDLVCRDIKLELSLF